MERLTQWTPTGASLILNNPQNDMEARQMLMEQFKKACNRLAKLEDKLESGGTIGKTDINERKPARGYHDGVAQGRKAVIREIAHLFDLHLKAACKSDKPSKNAEKALDKFYQIIQGDTEQ